MRNVKIDSTDSEFDKQLAELQPYTVHERTVTVMRPGQRTEMGGTEHTEPDIEHDSDIQPGSELEENTNGYNRRLPEFKIAHPDFDVVVGGSTVQITQAVRDEILRMPNGPEIVRFLAFHPGVAEHLLKMHPFEAARIIREEISPDLERLVEEYQNSKRSGHQTYTE